MSTAEVRRTPKGSANGFTPLQGLILDSTLRALGHSLQGGASLAALHGLKTVRNALRMAAFEDPASFLSALDHAEIVRRKRSMVRLQIEKRRRQHAKSSR